VPRSSGLENYVEADDWSFGAAPTRACMEGALHEAELMEGCTTYHLEILTTWPLS
jgi:hypothetical protein